MMQPTREVLRCSHKKTRHFSGQNLMKGLAPTKTPDPKGKTNRRSLLILTPFSFFQGSCAAFHKISPKLYPTQPNRQPGPRTPPTPTPAHNFLLVLGTSSRRPGERQGHAKGRHGRPGKVAPKVWDSGRWLRCFDAWDLKCKAV